MIRYVSFVLVLLLMALVNCDSSTSTFITGEIDYLGEADFFIEQRPLHYKYSPKIYTSFSIQNGHFEAELILDSPQILYITIQDAHYPVYAEPGNHIQLNIRRAKFPAEVEVLGPHQQINDIYVQFLTETKGLDAAIEAEMNKFKNGEPNNALTLARQKLEIAQKYLSGTPFNDIYLKIMGEELVLKLRAIEYNGRFKKGFNADSARQEIFNEALKKNFFSFNTLKAQRAGIRDFTHYYARTFGIYDSVQNEYKITLSEYDIKRLAYKQLNEKREEVLMYIAEPKAKAYAELFLIAERIGELPLTYAEPSYQEYITKYRHQFPEFVEFITWFYEEIQSVSPGQPAIPFSLPDIEGKIHTLEDFSGKYVLLDFWAGWCQPCLSEFPYMIDIYNRYPRNKFEIVGISTEIDSLVWVNDLRRFNNPWVQLYGGDGFNQTTFKAYKGGGIPFYVLIDPEGNILRYNDVRPSFNLTQVLDSLLASKKP